MKEGGKEEEEEEEAEGQEDEEGAERESLGKQGTLSGLILFSTAPFSQLSRGMRGILKASKMANRTAG